MIWGGGYLADVKDFAGGLVVHLTCGVGALVIAMVLGPRKGFPSTPMPPHNRTMVVTGAAMLWVGWFGFNAGSSWAADGLAGMAMLVTHISAATAALTWMAIEWIKQGKPTVIGIATGMVAGLATITPAAGSAAAGAGDPLIIPIAVSHSAAMSRYKGTSLASNAMASLTCIMMAL